MVKFKIKKCYNSWDKFLLHTIRFLHVSISNYAVIVNFNDNIEGRKIMIGNHSGAKGASVYRLSTPQSVPFMTWGAHPMIESYPKRWKYLYHIFYHQKLGFSKFKSFFSATIFGLVSKVLYNVAGILPIYYDFRFKSTIDYTFKCFENNVDILIFPEDSSKGYLDELSGLVPGFLTLSKLYYKKYGVDLPIYPMYFNRKYMTIIMDKPVYLQELMKTKSQEEILEFFRVKMNGLNHKYILKDQPVEDGDVSLEEFEQIKENALSKMLKRDYKNYLKCINKQEKISK